MQPHDLLVWKGFAVCNVCTYLRTDVKGINCEERGSQWVKSFLSFVLSRWEDGGCLTGYFRGNDLRCKP